MEAAKKPSIDNSASCCVLTIAGSDSSAGAGVQADLKTFAALGAYGLTAITSVTAQNTLGVSDVEILSAHIVRAQIEAVTADFDVRAAKIGMLGSEENVSVVAAVLHEVRFPLVLDPVISSHSGAELLSPNAIEVLRSKLLPMTALLTPNIPEAAQLLDWSEAKVVSAREEAAKALCRLGCQAVLLTGGHAADDQVEDVFVSGDIVRTFVRSKIETNNLHGTGCTLSAAVAAFLADGADMRSAVERAGDYVHSAISAARGKRLGRGSGPLSHFF